MRLSAGYCMCAVLCWKMPEDVNRRQAVLCDHSGVEAWPWVCEIQSPTIGPVERFAITCGCATPDVQFSGCFSMKPPPWCFNSMSKTLGQSQQWQLARRFVDVAPLSCFLCGRWALVWQTGQILWFINLWTIGGTNTNNTKAVTKTRHDLSLFCLRGTRPGVVFWAPGLLCTPLYLPLGLLWTWRLEPVADKGLKICGGMCRMAGLAHA